MNCIFSSKLFTLIILFVISSEVNGQQAFEMVYDRGDEYECLLVLNQNYYLAGADDTSHLRVYKLDNLGQVIWTHDYGSSNSPMPGSTFPSKMLASHDGNIILLGSYWPFGVNRKLYVAKIDTAGNLLWEYKFSPPNADDTRGIDIAETDDGYFIISGTFYSNNIAKDNILVNKIDSSGNLVWYQTFDFGNDQAKSVIINTNSNYIIGCNSSFAVFPDSSYGFMLSIDSSGSVLWNNLYGSAPGNFFASAVKTSDNNLVFCGNGFDSITQAGFVWVKKIDINGNLIWSKNYAINQQTFSISEGNGRFYLAGLAYYSTNPNHGFGDILTLDTSGNMQWNMEYQHCYALIDAQIDSNGFLVACGKTNYFNLGQDLFFTKLFSDGTLNIASKISDSSQPNIYPNPASSIIHIDCEINSNYKLNEIELYNINSQKICSSHIEGLHYTLNISNIKNGIYFMRVILLRNNNQLFTIYENVIINH
jgi:hypothetical protein